MRRHTNSNIRLRISRGPCTPHRIPSQLQHKGKGEGEETDLRANLASLRHLQQLITHTSRDVWLDQGHAADCGRKSNSKLRNRNTCHPRGSACSVRRSNASGLSTCFSIDFRASSISLQHEHKQRYDKYLTAAGGQGVRTLASPLQQPPLPRRRLRRPTPACSGLACHPWTPARYVHEIISRETNKEAQGTSAATHHDRENCQPVFR